MALSIAAIVRNSSRRIRRGGPLSAPARGTVRKPEKGSGMNTREQLNQYLRGLETRLRWMTVSKGVAIGAGVALGVTLAMVLITNALAFSSNSLLVARFVLFIALGTAVALALVLPLMRLNRTRAARRA